jgi:hypothetical protein
MTVTLDNLSTVLLLETNMKCRGVEVVITLP